MRLSAAALCAVVSVLSAAEQPPDLDTVLDRLSAWLTVYEREVSSVVADERMTQRLVPMTRFRNPDRRTLVSTYSFMRLPGGRSWLGFRDIRFVDGRAVDTAGPSLTDLIARGLVDNQALAFEMAWQSARHNLGAPRTTNVPMLPLELLHPVNRHHFAFALAGTERVAGVVTRRVAFSEHIRPSLIKSPDGRIDLLSEGMAWIEPNSGELRRAAIKARQVNHDGPVEWALSVEFTQHKQLGLLVPRDLSERFFMHNGSGEGRATYTNFRRFTTDARLLPPKP
jgi:hypothetical protein